MTLGRVLITGAGGFVGRALTPHLAARGWRVRAMTRDPRALIGLGVDVIPAHDLREPGDWSTALAGVDRVVHLAGLAHAKDDADEALYRRVNADAALELAHAALGRVGRFVLMSSIRAQCGPSLTGVATERDFPRPSDAYGRAKLAAETGLAKIDPGAVILRPTLVAGPGAAGNLATLARVAAAPAPLPLAGLSARRSLVSIRDLCEAVELALSEERMAGMTAIVADPQPLTIPDIVTAIRAGMGRAHGLIGFPTQAIDTLLLGARQFALRERVFGDLVASPALIMSLGWRPHEGARAALERLGAAWGR